MSHQSRKSKQTRPTLRDEFVRFLQLAFNWSSAKDHTPQGPRQRQPKNRQRRREKHSTPTPSLVSANPLEPVLPADALKDTWNRLAVEFFPDQRELLDSYTVRWAGRPQTSTLASCNVERRRVLVAPAMRLATCQKFLPALLYHEMCHAVLGIPEVINGRRRVHTREFRLLEQRHPEISQLDSWIKRGEWFAVSRAHRRQWRKQARAAAIN